MGTQLHHLDPGKIASSWLAEFDAAASLGNAKATTALFLEIGWLRDLLVFSWTHRSIHGHENITAFLADSLPKAQIRDIKLDLKHDISPRIVPLPDPMVEAAFVFDTPTFHGRGFIRLMEADGGEWKALSVFVMADDLKGYEEKGPESGYYEQYSKTWAEVQQEMTARTEKDLRVLIVGAGQSGLNVGARFRQMDIPALLIDKSNNIGDTWRQRYPSVTLHTPNVHHSFLYQDFPRNWPTYTPRDKLASWMEQYALHQELVIWMRSRVIARPSYDPGSKRWTVDVLKDGQKVTVHPYHIVLATGTATKPFIPSLLGRSEFQGHVYHGLEYKGGSMYAGRKAVVVGAGNTAADICQNLVAHGADSVTMVQRSSTIVVDSKYVSLQLMQIWGTQGDPSVGDFRMASMPLGLLKSIQMAQKDNRMNDQRSMLEGLRKAGLKVDEGPDGAGQLLQMYMRFGGYWLDVGAADQIISGKIRIKQGTEPAYLTPTSLIFQDGSSLEADLVVFATGFEPLEATVRDIFGDDVASKSTPLWGLNEECEINGAYTPCGVPNLWHAMGDFHYSRFYSKALAIQIKAREIGLVRD